MFVREILPVPSIVIQATPQGKNKTITTFCLVFFLKKSFADKLEAQSFSSDTLLTSEINLARE